MRNPIFFYYFLVIYLPLLQFNAIQASATQPESTPVKSMRNVSFNPHKVIQVICKLEDKPNNPFICNLEDKPPYPSAQPQTASQAQNPHDTHKSHTNSTDHNGRNPVQQHHQTQDSSNFNPIFLPQLNMNATGLTNTGKRSILKDTFQYELELQRQDKKKREEQIRQQQEDEKEWRREMQREARAAYEEEQRERAKMREEQARKDTEYEKERLEWQRHVEMQENLRKAREKMEREAKERCLKKVAGGCLVMAACIVVIVIPLSLRSTMGSHDVFPNNTTATNNTSIARSLNATVFNLSKRAPRKILYQNNTKSTLARLSKLNKR